MGPRRKGAGQIRWHKVGTVPMFSARREVSATGSEQLTGSNFFTQACFSGSKDDFVGILNTKITIITTSWTVGPSLLWCQAHRVTQCADQMPSICEWKDRISPVDFP
jgi:hypothetical protein